MPQVPYRPVSEASAQMIATPSVHEDASGAAFGQNIASAISGLGQGMEHVGNELFNRAVALQQLKNETEAKEADANYMMESGKIHAQFNSLQGSERVAAFDKYISDLKGLRDKYRNGLSNDMSRRMFDSSSLGTFSRSVFSGAVLSADANRKWHHDISITRQSANDGMVTQMPEEDSVYERAIEVNKNEIEGVQRHTEGYDDELTKFHVDKANSHTTALRILSMATKDPYRANEMLKQYRDRLVNPADLKQAEAAVQGQLRSVGSENIANDIYRGGLDPDGNPTKSLKDLEVEAAATAKKISPDDPEMPKHAIAAIQRKWNQDRYAVRQEQTEYWGTIQSAIANGAKSEQEMRADPKVANAIDQLYRVKTKQALDLQISNMIKSRDRDIHLAEENRLLGMANSDPGKFLEEQIVGNKLLNETQIHRLIKMREQIMNKRDAFDSRISKANQVMLDNFGTQMAALKIDRKPAAESPDLEDYYHYRGALHVALDTFQEDHGRRPTDKEIVNDIGPKVLRGHAVKGWFGRTHDEPFFKQEVPEEYTKKYLADVAKAGEDPSEVLSDEIYRHYLRDQWKLLYKGSSGGKSDGGRTQP